MHKGRRFVAASLTLMMSVTSAFSADIVKCAGNSADHKDKAFRFGTVSRVWRAVIPGNPGCSQFVLRFSNDSDFTTVDAKIVKMPAAAACDPYEGKPATTGLSGAVQVYCVSVGGRIDRYASVVIWNNDPKAQPYGAIYSVMGADAQTNGEPTFYGVAVDSVANTYPVTILLMPEKKQ